MNARRPRRRQPNSRAGVNAALRGADPERLVTEAAFGDLHVFVEEAWPVVVRAEPFQPNWHIDAICAHLEALARGEFWNLLINVPPRHAKSNICGVLFPAWCWISDPTLRVMGASYSEALSMRDSLAMRRLVESAWYQRRWPLALADDQNVKSRWENDRGGWRMATSTRGPATGEGADLLVVDDPHNVTEAESEVERKQVLDWFNVAMPTRTGRGGRRKTVVVMQRIHEADLSADIIDKGSFVHLCLPQEYEPGRSKGWSGWAGDPRKEEGELLWPARFSEEVIAATQRPPHMTAYAYAGQMQQRPAPMEGGMFKRESWKFYKESALELIKKMNDSCWSWDLALTGEGDYVVGQCWIRIGGNFYLLDQIRGKLTFAATKAMIAQAAVAFPRIKKQIIEKSANAHAAHDDLKGPIGGLELIPPLGGKIERAQPLESYVSSGNVYLPMPSKAPWVRDFIEEHSVFPNGAHDDQVDAAGQAVAWLAGRMGRGFKPVVDSITQSTNPWHGGERYRDPRYGDGSIVVRSERGDDRPRHGGRPSPPADVTGHPHERPVEETTEADLRMGRAKAERWRRAWRGET